MGNFHKKKPEIRNLNILQKKGEKCDCIFLRSRAPPLSHSSGEHAGRAKHETPLTHTSKSESLVNNLPETARIAPEPLLENPVKITQIIKTALITDFRNLFCRVPEQLGGVIQPMLVDILNNRPLGRLLIKMTKMLTTQTEPLRQVRKLKRPPEIRFDHPPDGGNNLFMRGFRLFRIPEALEMDQKMQQIELDIPLIIHTS